MSTSMLFKLHSDPAPRAARDRLEVLTALINGPTVDAFYRPDVIYFPAGHSTYGWECHVPDCERTRRQAYEFCTVHLDQWRAIRDTTISAAEFTRTAEPGERMSWAKEVTCRICPDRPASSTAMRLCHRHQDRWHKKPAADFDQWLAEQTTLAGYGNCLVTPCPDLASSPLRLCHKHRMRYNAQGAPGQAELPREWWHAFENRGLPVIVEYDDEAAFRQWCHEEPPILLPGRVILTGLRPLLKAEVRWGLFAHTDGDRSEWPLTQIQNMINLCRGQDLHSLSELDPDECPHVVGMIVREMRNELRLIYFSRSDTRDAGFIETDHFGRRFPGRFSHFDLTAVSQRWLRDLLWDYMARTMESPKCPRTSGVFDNARRACTELSAFLEVEAPAGGHDPHQLDERYMSRFVADQRHRERHRLPSLAMKRAGGKSSTVTENTRRAVFNSTRQVLRGSLDSGESERIGLSRTFITAMPHAGGMTRRSRAPFSDDVAKALADETNLRHLAENYDPDDQGLRDIWEAIVLTGRRCSEILNLRMDCVGRYGELPMIWHDQTKVGNYDEAIRIPDTLYNRIQERQKRSLARFERRHGYTPTGRQQAEMALFPTRVRNPSGNASMSYGWFHSNYKLWIEGLDLGHVVPHQARHTLATNLLRAGANLTHIRRYLGQISDRMAEHYVKVAHSDLEEVLHHVWVSGPGAAQPGELLSGGTTPMTRAQAQALAVDLSRRSTPSEGGFCTFQPVVDGGACPWKLDCHNCDKFVMSGADLLYWRRKQEQWTTLAERAPDDATADYLHSYFEPTARAIDGLEKALAGLGLLDEALALDLRRPQDYFHRIWSTSFKAADLADAVDLDDDVDDLESGNA
ncbi:site-specific integrase [Streptomyces sp. ITFR-16]|uniref:tyrosine-type recombinase/integrase n=1 Tax=Streptomyces sp. ITFR-16 TaxID=3075198 RepID=UPI00288C1B45|nr:site-specific integrase [Streptomyces sp. ITFR-16]WNI22179.1 site-specific integrase [Streptomyces sp. ITFR-16]